MHKKNLSLLLLTIYIMGCASAYRPMVTRHASYLAASETGNILMEYRYEVLKESENKKYARKANDKGIQLVAVAITNDSQNEIVFGEDVKLYANNEPITPLRPEAVKRQVRQVSGWYMFWGLFWIFISSCENGNCNVIPLPIGLVIGLGNMAKAQKANRYFVEDMEHNSPMNKTIAPGETVYGLLPLKVKEGETLELRLK